MNQANREFKSSVFTHLFREFGKEYELYNAIAPGRFPPDTPIKDVTLTNALFMDRVNDLSFVLGDKLVVFFEHQSTINKNMPLRDLIYCGRVYEKIISNETMYNTDIITIPTPEFYVLYNGISEFPERAVYRLSEMYALPPESEPALELIVHVYNINEGYNKEIIKKSEALHGYVTLVTKVKENKIKNMSLFDAVSKAVNDCIKEGILTDYLTRSGSEVSNMLIQEWDWDVAKKVWQNESAEKARAEERKKAKAALAIERKKAKAALSKKDKKIANQEVKLRDQEVKLNDQEVKLSDQEIKLTKLEDELAAIKTQLNIK